MNSGKKIMNILKNGGLFVIIVFVTFKLLFSKVDFKEILRTLAHVNITYILIGMTAMSASMLCEAVNIKRSLKKFNEKATLLQCIRYSLSGFFFSAITPAATGGQPMQVYFMHKRKISVSNAMLALLICLATYQFVTVSIAVISLIVKFKFFTATLGKFIWILYIGIGLNIILLLVILIAIFSKKFIFKVLNLIVKIIDRFNKEKAKKFKKKALIEIEMYKNGADYIKDDKFFIIKTTMIAFMQVVALHSVPFWVSKAFEIPGWNIAKFIAIQSALYISGAALPLPGAVGIGEGGFLIFFKTIFKAEILSSAMILSRFISFYLMILVGAIAVISLQLSLNKEKKSGKIYPIRSN